MPTLGHSLAAHFAISQMVMRSALKDLTDADARTRMRGDSGPSIAWTVGHLCHYKIEMLGMLGHPKENPFTATFTKTAATDGSDYPSLERLAQNWDALCGELAAALEAATDEQLDALVPGSDPAKNQKIGDRVRFFAWHEPYHIGVINAMRKELGKKGIAER